MGLKKFHNKLNKYEQSITKKLKTEEKKNIKIISATIIISIIISYIIFEFINPKWFRIFKIKIKYNLLELIELI